MAPVANRRMSSSSSDRKNRLSPGSPWRPDAAPELVVDTAGLVALAAEHVEPAELADLVAFVCAFLLELGAEASRTRPAPSSVSRSSPSADDLVAGQALGVAAEQDVDASTGHVGGHRHRVEPARLGDDLGFPGVLLGVQDLVGDAPLARAASRAARTWRPTRCRRGPAGPSRSARRCRRPRRRTWPPRSCR